MCLAVPGKVLSVEDNLARVEINGIKQSARLDTLSEEVEPGDYLLVHTGFAIRRIPPEEAKQTLKLFDEYIRVAEGLEEESGV